MPKIDRNIAPSELDVSSFLDHVTFKLPNGFLDFYRRSNGAEIISDNSYTILWPINDMPKLNLDYQVEEYIPDFFIFGTNGGDTAFAIEKIQALYSKCHL